MKFISIYVAILIVCSCKAKPDKMIIRDSGLLRHTKFPFIARETNVQKLVSQIDNSDCVYMGGIGFTGEENQIYDCYLRLLEIAPDSIWVELSYNKNPVIRIYSFKALKTRKSPRLPEVIGRLQMDTATFCYVSGDVSMPNSVGGFIENTK